MRPFLVAGAGTRCETHIFQYLDLAKQPLQTIIVLTLDIVGRGSIPRAVAPHAPAIRRFGILRRHGCGSVIRRRATSGRA